MDPIRSVYRAWCQLGDLLSRVMHPLVMAVFYYGIVTPMAWIVRSLRKDPLGLRPDAGTSSYWVKRDPDPSSKGSFKNQF